MEATDEEILGIDRNATVADLRRARRESAKVYHVDKHQHLEQGVQDVLTLRMKERNAAADRVLARLKAKPKA
jgi:DnaJ-class molecular chaperone